MLMLAHVPAPGGARAQDAVQARIATHAGYARLVFDWPTNTTYQITQDGSRVEIRFARPGTMSAPTGSDNNIVAVEQLAGGNAPLAVAVTLAPGRSFRHFTIGSRVIIDVNDPSAPAVATPAPVPAPTPAPAPAARPAATSPPMPAKAVEAVTEDPLPPAEPVAEPRDNVAALEAHTISITSTENIGVAAFSRFNTLWLVVDRPDFNVPPTLSGPQRDRFAGFERINLPNATVYRMPLPAGAGPHIYGEGSGLVWRVVITPGARQESPVLPQRQFAGDDPARGGTVNWPLRQVTKLIEVPDAAVGDTVTVATVPNASQYTGALREFVDFTALHAPVGMAILPRADDLKVELAGGAVKISRPDGLALSRVRDVRGQQIREQVQEPVTPIVDSSGIKRIFDFDRWRMGGESALRDNQHILLAGAGNKDKNGRAQDLLTLAKMNIANDRGQEALGFLNFAAQELPDLVKSPEFLALRGAAEALAGKYELAWRDLNDPSLRAFGEVDYWRAFTLAWLEDWQQAGETMPASFDLVAGYPLPLLEKIGVKLAEIALRKNEVPKAENILATLDRQKAQIKPWTQAGLDYLRGQAYRQKGEPDKTRPLWEPLLKGKDNFYRARTGLALTMLELESGNIVLAQAIDRLEGLRYAWRGDELEAQINFTLGKLYLQNEEYMKGFVILRDAAELRPSADIKGEINDYMVRAFVDLLLHKEDLSPADAVVLYEEFKALTPDTEEGRQMVRKLAERLIAADLLTRGAAILQDQVDFRAGGAEQAQVAMRLAAVYLLDKDPQPALGALDKAKAYYAAQSDEASKAKVRAADLMRARALSQMNMTEDAIALLNGFPPDPDINRLRADIAWNAGLWEDAAKALQDMILDAGIDPERRALSLAEADIILNRAVALNLSGNRVALANMQNRYGPAMQKTARARLFDVVTRPRKASIIADRDTIEQIVSEVDMFKGFLDAYKQTQDLGSN